MSTGLRLGGPIFDTPNDPEELARAHLTCGYRAAYCPEVSLSNKNRIREIRRAFKKYDVLIAEVGAWCNLISVKNSEREKNFKYVCERLALAEEIGAHCCVDSIGTLDPDSRFGPYPDNLSRATFELTVDTVRQVLDEVKPSRTKFALEMMQWVFPDSADSYLELIHAVDRPSFGVHMDPVNLIVSPRLYFDNGVLIRECFQKLGKWIVSCHAKDIVLRNKLALHLDEVRPGVGNLNYKTYLTELNRLPGEVPIMLEHLSSAEEYIMARDYLFCLGKELGIKFGEQM